MYRQMLSLVALCVASPASADLAADMRKLLLDDRAWFYLRVCAEENETGIRDLLDKYGALVYRKDDDSDDANDWRYRYKQDWPDPKPTAECDEARAVLLNSIYAPAIRPKAKP